MATRPSCRGGLEELSLASFGGGLLVRPGGAAQVRGGGAFRTPVYSLRKTTTRPPHSLHTAIIHPPYSLHTAYTQPKMSRFVLCSMRRGAGRGAARELGPLRGHGGRGRAGSSPRPGLVSRPGATKLAAP